MIATCNKLIAFKLKTFIQILKKYVVVELHPLYYVVVELHPLYYVVVDCTPILLLFEAFHDF